MASPLLRTGAIVTLAAGLTFAFTGPVMGRPAPRAAKSPPVNPLGQMLALSCSGCHGTDGVSSSIIPSISGKSAQYIESAMKEFRSGERVSTVMQRHAKGYTDEEIHLIAAYFGTIGSKNVNRGH